jgi:hypothetical protein
MPSITYIWTTFVKAALSKFIISKSKHFWTKCAYIGYKKTFINLSPFAFLIINVNILSNFPKEWCTFGRKKGGLKTRIVHSRSLNGLNMQKHFWFVSNFEHVNFAINETYSKKHYDNPNYYASLVIFQTYKNAILRSVHSLRWFFWLWFYPLVFFGNRIS